MEATHTNFESHHRFRFRFNALSGHCHHLLCLPSERGMDIEIIFTISESPGTDVQRHDGLHHVSGSHTNDRHIHNRSFRYESGVGCMRILNVHIIAVVMREVFQGAASRVVRGMCSVVLKSWCSLCHLIWLIGNPDGSCCGLPSDGCGIQVEVVAVRSLTVQRNCGGHMFFGGCRL